jgi:methylase of polypeptide subunit release factors
MKLYIPFGKVETEVEPTWFDELTKAVATKSSRRRAFKLLSAGLGGVVLGLFDMHPAWAATTDCTDFCNQALESATRNCESHNLCVKNFTCGPNKDGSCEASATCGPCTSG